MSHGPSHPRYRLWAAAAAGTGTLALVGDDVALATPTDLEPLGTVVEIHAESFGDGPGDTITVIPAAVTLSTGDRYPVADLVLLRRAEA